MAAALIVRPPLLPRQVTLPAAAVASVRPRLGVVEAAAMLAAEGITKAFDDWCVFHYPIL